MKKTLVLLLIVFFAGCGNNPTPSPTPGPGPTPTPIPTPVPVPVITFQVVGKKMDIKAQMKTDPKVSLEEMRGALRATVAQLEGVALEDVLVF